jgi:hypothetical protein
MKYLDLISQDEKKVDKQQLEHLAAETSLNLQKDLLDYTKQVSIAKRALDSAKASKSFSTANVINCMREVEEAEQTVEEIKALQKELFG